MPFSTKLKRTVNTKGWVSTDFHNHSTPSGDNVCGTNDRIINLAAEHIEFAPTTEHNRVYDWQPHIDELKLTKEISTVPGIELTGSGAHLNAFPITPSPYLQDNGSPKWVKDPRINAINLRDHHGHKKNRWIHINHPDMVENFNDRNKDGYSDNGYEGIVSLIDAIETQNYQASEILGQAPYQITRRASREQVSIIREFVWLQMLNQGRRVWGIAVSDAHTVFGNGVGGWRTYIPSSTDNPQEIDWEEINTLTSLKEHQEFLLKLLTNKDSFIRKKIIDQNLAYLNNRLTNYLDRLGLPHSVTFQNDLSVEITQLGQDLDFDNLSRGERNRLILGMSFAFRDVWESLYQNINLLFIDELIDSGMDANGVENSLSVLKKMARERDKNIYLISHKDELIGRVNNVLKVIKENGFTSYENDVQVIE